MAPFSDQHLLYLHNITNTTLLHQHSKRDHNTTVTVVEIIFIILGIPLAYVAIFILAMVAGVAIAIWRGIRDGFSWGVNRVDETRKKVKTKKRLKVNRATGVQLGKICGSVEGAFEIRADMVVDSEVRDGWGWYRGGGSAEGHDYDDDEFGEMKKREEERKEIEENGGEMVVRANVMAEGLSGDIELDSVEDDEMVITAAPSKPAKAILKGSKT